MSLMETIDDLKSDLGLNGGADYSSLETMANGESKYVRDLRINLRNALQSENINEKEALLIALAVAVNEKNKPLVKSFTELAKEKEATDTEIAEMHACTSLLSVNNVFYRFRHFTGKESYNQMPARIKMNIMMNPVTGKEFFELVSLVVSAVNGCEQCVKSHEASVLNQGGNEERVFDAIRLSAIVRGLSQVLN